jgi:hypothetical protein
MIDMNRWRAMGQLFAAGSEIKTFIYGASDEDIRAKVDALSQTQYPVLVGILPSIMGIGANLDQLGYESPLFFYCMTPKTNQSEGETDEAWDLTLEGVKSIVKAIKDNHTNHLWREFYHVRPDTIHVDPEFDMWDLMGWSVRFEIEFADTY